MKPRNRKILAGILVVLGVVLMALAPETPRTGGIALVVVGIAIEVIGITLEKKR